MRMLGLKRPTSRHLPEDPVNSHKNAKLAFQGRVLLVSRVIDDDWRVAEAAAASSISDRSARKWISRFRKEGLAGLLDRSSRPDHSPRKTSRELEYRIRAKRLERKTGPQISRELNIPLSTVGRVLRRLEMGKLPPAVPRPPVIRYEREFPGELIHVDSKRLGRIAPGLIGHRITGKRPRTYRETRKIHPGWECLHIAIDDASRLAYANIFPDNSAETAITFIGEALSWFESLGVKVERVMTDNAFCYTRSRYQLTLNGLGISHLRIKPYTPRTNGKAERFIQTALREWAYFKPYTSSDERASELAGFLAAYNTVRPHSAHGQKPPISRLKKAEQRI